MTVGEEFTNSFTEQSALLLQSFILGMAVGAVYGLLKIYRYVFKCGAVRLFFQDVLFFAAWGLVSFLFSLIFNNGTVRIYLIIGNIAGAAAYNFTVGRAVVWLAESVIKKIKSRLAGVKRKFIIPAARAVDAKAEALVKKFCRVFFMLFLPVATNDKVKNKNHKKKRSKNAKKIQNKRKFVLQNKTGVL